MSHVLQTATPDSKYPVEQGHFPKTGVPTLVAAGVGQSVQTSKELHLRQLLGQGAQAAVLFSKKPSEQMQLVVEEILFMAELQEEHSVLDGPVQPWHDM